MTIEQMQQLKIDGYVRQALAYFNISAEEVKRHNFLCERWRIKFIDRIYYLWDRYER